MKKKIRCLRLVSKCLLIAASSLLCAPLFADDAIEGALTGNITFEITPELVMQDETLTISKSSGQSLGTEKVSIDVDFHFKNISSHDITRKIAFVLPPVQCREDAASAWRGLSNHASDRSSGGALSDFVTKVDGVPQSYLTRTEAFLGKRDVTALLEKLHLPQNPCDIKMGHDGLPDPQYRETLVKHHLLTATNDPAWHQRIYFEWTQTFPAGKTIHIQHRYTPVVGEAVVAKRSIKELNQLLLKSDARRPAIWSAPFSSICAMPIWVQYHLTTGAYWRGGIRHFKLIINDSDGSPMGVNSFYSPSQVVRKTINHHAMTFEMKNFTPNENLRVLYLSQPHNKEERKLCSE